MTRTDQQREAHARLMVQVAEGDHEAFERLYDEFADMVWAIVRSMLRDDGLAQDAAQDAWIKVWNVAGTFDASRSSVATWITTLTHRHAIDVLRRRRVRAGELPGAEAGDEVAARIGSSTDVSELATDAVFGEEVRATLEQLRPEHRQALELAWFTGLSQREIAEATGKPIGTIKTYMYQGLRELRRLLETGGLVDA